MSLTIKDSFMFYAVMMDPEQCRKLLTLILNMEVERVTVYREDTLMYHPDYHGIRLDVLAKEKGRQRRFNVEMQTKLEGGLERRTRYYHSQLDSDALLTGEGYEQLSDAYVIFICDFDPVGKALYRYCFEMTCQETGTRLNDGTYTIFLSTKGKNKEAVPQELVSFLEYVANPAAGVPNEDSFVQSLETQISTIKKDREWRNKYMLLELTLERERRYAREEGRAEGLEEGRAEGHAEGLEEGRAEGRAEGREEGRAEGREEGRAEGLKEGRAEGQRMLIRQCCRKLAKGQSAEMIADALECELSEIAEIIKVAQEFAPGYDADGVFARIQKKQS